MINNKILGIAGVVIALYGNSMATSFKLDLSEGKCKKIWDRLNQQDKKIKVKCGAVLPFGEEMTPKERVTFHKWDGRSEGQYRFPTPVWHTSRELSTDSTAPSQEPSDHSFLYLGESTESDIPPSPIGPFFLAAVLHDPIICAFPSPTNSSVMESFTFTLDYFMDRKKDRIEATSVVCSPHESQSFQVPSRRPKVTTTSPIED